MLPRFACVGNVPFPGTALEATKFPVDPKTIVAAAKPVKGVPLASVIEALVIVASPENGPKTQITGLLRRMAWYRDKRKMSATCRAAFDN